MSAPAAEQHASLVDGVPVLNAHAGGFDDMCHFDAGGHRLVGERLARELARALTLTLAPPPDS